MGRHAVQQSKVKANHYSDEDEEALQSDSDQSERPLKQAASKPKKDTKKKRPAEDVEDEEENKPIAKKKRVSKPKQSASKTPPEEEENDEQILEVKVNDEGEKYLDLGKKRRATVRAFKGTVFLDIREYYGQEGDEKPGKKGVTLNQDQWTKLKESQDAIDILFKKMKK